MFTSGGYNSVSTIEIYAMKNTRKTIGTLLLAGAAVAASVASAAYPDRAIEFVVPFAAGGGLDQNARNMAQAMGQVLGQTIVVNNRAGAAGTIGLASVARATPDGYTLAFTPAVPLSSGPHRLTGVNYNLDSFDYVCQVFDNIFSIAVRGDSPYKTLQDLLDDAKAKPGTISYGTSGVGSIPHLGTSNIEHELGVSLNHIPYKGDGPMLADLLSDRLEFGAVLASSITGQIQAGQLRLLAVYSDKRHPSFPDVPTLTEAGVPVVQLSFGGILAPAGTPADILATLESACQKATTSDAYVEWAKRANQVVDFKNGEAFRERMKTDSDQQAATLKRLGLDKQ